MIPRRTAAGRDDHALINSVSCRLSVLGCATSGAHNGAPRSQGSVFPAFFVTGWGFESPRLHLSWFAEILEISGKFPPTEDLGLPTLPEALFCFCPFPPFRATSCAHYGARCFQHHRRVRRPGRTIHREYCWRNAGHLRSCCGSACPIGRSGKQDSTRFDGSKARESVSKKFRELVEKISWETEVWLADSPGHMIHCTGDKFLGPRRRNTQTDARVGQCPRWQCRMVPRCRSMPIPNPVVRCGFSFWMKREMDFLKRRRSLRATTWVFVWRTCHRGKTEPYASASVCGVHACMPLPSSIQK